MTILMVKYVRVLQSIIRYANETNTDIFGAHYKNIYHLISDASFINTLSKKNCYFEIEDKNLSQLIEKGSKLLRIQTICALLFAIYHIATIILNNGQ